MELVMEGYDHILDVVDEEGASITDVVAQRGDTDMSNLLASIPAFEVNYLKKTWHVLLTTSARQAYCDAYPYN